MFCCVMVFHSLLGDDELEIQGPVLVRGLFVPDCVTGCDPCPVCEICAAHMCLTIKKRSESLESKQISG